MKARDLSGQKFDMLTALYPVPGRRDSCVLWMCQCECGAMKTIPSTDLTRHRVKSCGCLKHRVKDITGERRGHLTALRYTGEQDENGYAIYEWRCDCGNIVTRSISGTARRVTTCMCPECQRRVKVRQINEARENRTSVQDTGLTRKYIENIINGVPTRKNQSGVRGVHWHGRHQRWVATGIEDGNVIVLGEYRDLAEAQKAREIYVQKKYGACLGSVKGV